MNKYLVKLAAEKKKEKPHVEEALNKLDQEKGVMLHWGVGAGKTRAFLLAAKKALDEDKKKDALIVAPASLVSNIDQELDKHKIKLDRNRLEVLSYEKAVNKADELAKRKFSIAVADEAQRLRNPDTKRVDTLRDIFSDADKRVLATATAQYNQASDLAALMNITAGRKIMPEDRKEFENRYLQKIIIKPGWMDRLRGKPDIEETEVKNHRELKKMFENHVSYYDPRKDPENADKYPTMTESTIDMEFSPEQARHYAFMENKLPWLIRAKLRHNLPLSKQEMTSMNAFSTGVRQVSTGYRHLHKDGETEYTPKIIEATDRLEKAMKENPKFRGLVYSNFIDAGLGEYSKKLNEKGIAHTVYTGALSRKQKDQAIEDYNSGKTPVLLVSASGSEGLSLKGTRLVQILEPFWNRSRIDQVKGRASRYESHMHLPEEERNVHVEHFRSVFRKPLLGKAPYSIDRYLSENSDTKATISDKIESLMEQSGK